MEDQRSVADTIREFEEYLLRSDIRNSAPTIDRLLADEFVEFGSSGRVFDKQQMIEALKEDGVACQRSLRDFSIRLLAPGVVLATYRASRKDDNIDEPVEFLRSSLWKLIDSRWQMVFHQGTLSKDSR
jgi:hypothetical protein